MALAAGLGLARAARADGDPASDVLATQTLFLPQDAALSEARQSQLAALLSGAARVGVPLRVAVIASPADLGSVAELWRQPQTYARFLAQELALVYSGPLLVVMPDGLGLHVAGRGAARSQAAIAGLRAAGSVPALGSSTLAAIDRIAAASGHPVSVPAAAAPSGSPTSTDSVAWIVFGVGALLIVVAWALSLRARPLQATNTDHPA